MDTNNEKKTELEPMDSRAYLEAVLSGRYPRIPVTGWDEVDAHESNAPFVLLRIDQYDEYHDKKYFCTTTTDGKLPL
jgi:hypothetical protein